jgi:hypothetical protein
MAGALDQDDATESAHLPDADDRKGHSMNRCTRSGSLWAGRSRVGMKTRATTPRLIASNLVKEQIPEDYALITSVTRANGTRRSPSGVCSRALPTTVIRADWR